MDYRFYLLDDHICAADVFSAQDDMAAAEIAKLAYEGCADAVSGFELWRSNRLVAQSQGVRGPIPALTPSNAPHQTAFELLEKLQKEFMSVRKSTKLAELIAKRGGQSASARMADESGYSDNGTEIAIATTI